jgi:very-short-patch-repair endonuclease
VSVRGWIAAEQAATAYADDVATDLSKRLASLPSAVIEALAEAAQGVATALIAMDLLSESSSWSAEDWRVRSLADWLSDRDVPMWEQLERFSPMAHTAREQLDGLGLVEVRLPVFSTEGSESLSAQLAATRTLHDWLLAGGELRRRFPKPPQRNAQFILDGATVNGVHPTSPELLNVVLPTMEATHTADALSVRWAVAGIEIDMSQPVLIRIGHLVGQADSLTRIREIVAARDRVVAELGAAGMPILLPDIARWLEFANAVSAVRAQQEADAATASMEEQLGQLAVIFARDREPAPELAAAIGALQVRDADRYELRLAELTEARHQQADQLRCNELKLRLHDAHPGLAQLLERTAADEVWESRVGLFDAAWSWGHAWTFFNGQRQPGRDTRLDGELTDAVARFEQVTGRLAATRAWQQALGRMTAPQAQALRAYRDHMTQRGAGHGRYAGRFEQAAREAMVSARDAVPVWIMPLPEVLETIPPDRNSFDVVIVDEASQASIEALFLLWLAPRVVVVGDDRQCTPSMVSHGELQPIFERLETYLPDVPNYLRVAFTPRSSLFSLLSTRFGSVIRLREHFRCMPEIIGWSSRQFYSDAPLIPLRQFGADRLPPLRTSYVSGAYAEGSSTRLRNPAEALALVEQLTACLADPGYAEKTFGVVALQGTGQIALIQQLLWERIPTTVWEQRRIRVGTPPDFQGDERSVMFISMVVADPPRAVTALEWQRRFNVAASRAQDQLWLFHSVTLDALSPIDLRRNLLAYVIDPPAPDVRGRLDDVREDVPHPSFDSLFEQRVFLRIREHGFHVTPQVEVNNRRIDLVVTGAKGRLAVECDGEYWHSTPEQREADLHREISLRRANWKFWRIRESEFYFDHDSALRSLWTTLAARGIEPFDYMQSDEAPSSSGTWEPGVLSDQEGIDGIDDDPLGAAGLDLVDPFVPLPTRNGRRDAIRSATRSRQRTTTPFGSTGRKSAQWTAADVREWALAIGLDVGSRGRLPPAVIEAWNQEFPGRSFEP